MALTVKSPILFSFAFSALIIILLPAWSRAPTSHLLTCSSNCFLVTVDVWMFLFLAQAFRQMFSKGRQQAIKRPILRRHNQFSLNRFLHALTYATICAFTNATVNARNWKYVKRYSNHTLINAAVEMNPLQCNLLHWPWQLLYSVLMCGTVATSPAALRWLCDSPRTGCARRTKISMRGANKQ